MSATLSPSGTSRSWAVRAVWPFAPLGSLRRWAVRAVSRTARDVFSVLRRWGSSRPFAKPPFNQFRRYKNVTESSMTEIMKPNSE
jgi:hypothetical protein